MRGLELASRARGWRLAGALALLVLLASGWAAFLVVRAKAQLWLPDYLARLASPSPRVEGTRHLLFVFVDHYEPGLGEAGVAKNHDWLERYRALAARHRDSQGRPPQHTWFYAADHRNAGVMRDLARAAYEGLGEVELHLHHGDDTDESFRAKLAEAVAWFGSFGALVGEDGRASFGFIHGNWALDDSRTKAQCGVRRELTLLREAGCYADFTFPAVGTVAQPRKVNSIYYATDDGGPKSYDSGVDARVGGRVAGGFLVFEGPMGLKLGRYFTDAADVETGHEPTAARVDRWVRTGVHVEGRPEWVFVKVHTHGIQSRAVVLGEHADAMFAHLEERYAKGGWRLHYVTAREAYNVVRAAEDGLAGDPDAYRDHELRPPLNALRRLD